MVSSISIYLLIIIYTQLYGFKYSLYNTNKLFTVMWLQYRFSRLSVCQWPRKLGFQSQVKSYQRLKK